MAEWTQLSVWRRGDHYQSGHVETTISLAMWRRPLSVWPCGGHYQSGHEEGDALLGLARGGQSIICQRMFQTSLSDSGGATPLSSCVSCRIPLLDYDHRPFYVSHIADT